MNKQTMLMNPHTGSVDTMENWKSDWKGYDKYARGLLREWMSELLEVELINGEWIEVQE